jgi:multidrug efflux pump
MVGFYGRTLRVVLQHRALTMLTLVGTIALTGVLYQKANKGWFPADDSGLIWGSVSASTEISFEAMVELTQKATEVVLADPAVAGVASSVGTSGYNASANRAQLYISLKPLSERRISAFDVVNRLRPKINAIPGLTSFMFPAQDVRSPGGRSADASYQFTLWTPDYEDLLQWGPVIRDRMQKLPKLVDVSDDRQQGGLQVNVVIDRLAASRLGVRNQDIQTAINNAFGQRQISTLYTQRNNYRVILEIDPQYQRDPTDLDRIYVPGQNGVQVPLAAVTRIERGLQPLVVNHQGQFPAITIGFSLAPNVTIEEATQAVDRAVAELHVPASLHAEFQGEARAYRQSIGTQPLLVLAALFAVYIVLGVLYESLAHPLTILSTLPSAGLGALLALSLARTEITLIAFIGIILLIGIVKKNGIMLVDFALEAERSHSLEPEEAIYQACLERFRPILMTTLAALLGALPLLFGTGPGSELRRPLGITIVGGLLVSQLLTLYTTPVIYLMLDKLHRRLWGTRSHRDVIRQALNS